MAYKHFIITRFWEDFNNSDPYSWINSRVDLFNNIYLRGINNQTIDTFENIFLISKKFINYDFSKFNFSKIKHKKVISEEFYKNPSIILSPSDMKLDYIITSRVDSDDLLGQRYIENIQKHQSDNLIVDHQNYMMLSPSFMTYELKSGAEGACSSMFISTFFKPQEISQLNCYSEQHALIRKKFKNQIEIKGIGSAAICHGGNVSNKIEPQNIRSLSLEEFHSIFGKI